MQIQYAGKITKDDFLKGILLNRVHLKGQKWVIGMVWLMLVFSIVYLLVQNPSKLSGIFPSLLLGFVGFAVFSTFPWWIPYLQASSYNQKGNIYRNNIYGVVDDHGITVNSAELKTNFQWSVYSNYKIAKDLVLLYQGKNCFNMFKQSMFSDQGEWEKFLALVEEKVSARKKRV